ncbi:hypothetical protein EVAR_19565_1 [Eumeta japonica]|uniref:Uncharacterized protein n=1 Tax=Eumeta variegata TaxID=151549 RepID=A0A4C1UF91_EUMVA|nr:hypothetical protein EVAR_19565_1 [Eumeta japonica]
MYIVKHAEVGTSPAPLARRPRRLMALNVFLICNSEGNTVDLEFRPLEYVFGDAADVATRGGVVSDNLAHTRVFAPAAACAIRRNPSGRADPRVSGGLQPHVSACSRLAPKQEKVE